MACVFVSVLIDVGVIIVAMLVRFTTATFAGLLNLRIILLGYCHTRNQKKSG
jgi:hypothetical protein